MPLTQKVQKIPHRPSGYQGGGGPATAETIRRSGDHRLRCSAASAEAGVVDGSLSDGLATAGYDAVRRVPRHSMLGRVAVRWSGSLSDGLRPSVTMQCGLCRGRCGGWLPVRRSGDHRLRCSVTGSPSMVGGTRCVRRSAPCPTVLRPPVTMQCGLCRGRCGDDFPSSGRQTVGGEDKRVWRWNRLIAS